MHGDLGLGNLITTEQHRDAIHIAVAPMEAGAVLKPGEHVRLNGDGRAVRGVVTIGIVDPFLLVNEVQEGERFWLFLYPNTVTSLRHHWEHPAFNETDDSTAQVGVEEAVKWMQWFATDVMNMSYAELLVRLNDYVLRGDLIWLGCDIPDGLHDNKRKMWACYTVITGNTVVDQDDVPFYCSC